MDKLIQIIKEMMSNRTWGTLEIKFEDGKIVFIKKTENIKP